MFTTICISQIRDNYYYGQYGSFAVVINKETGYVNATKLCTDGGKSFRHWNSTKMASEMTDALRQYNFEFALTDNHENSPWSMAQYRPLADVLHSVQTL